MPKSRSQDGGVNFIYTAPYGGGGRIDPGFRNRESEKHGNDFRQERDITKEGNPGTE